MSADTASFSLEHFEFLAYTRQREPAARELLKLLLGLDAGYGILDINAHLYATNASDQSAHLLSRLTAAMSCLFSDPDFFLSPQGFGEMICCQRWISSLFAASPFGNADHILKALNLNGESDMLQLSADRFLKFCMLYTPDSNIPVDVDALWAYDKAMAAGLFLVLLSPRFLCTTAAHDKREVLLKWLPERLGELESLDQLPVRILHDVYMHCSYADLESKHAIKAPINRLIRSALLARGLSDLGHPVAVQRAKPRMLVVIEYLSTNHSIYRTHSSTLRAAKPLFELIGVGMDAYVDDSGREIFDQFISVSGDAFAIAAQIRTVAQELKPDILYMPSLGMFQSTMFLANLRLAPLQIMALGHPATTHSPFIDYVVVEEDYVGDPACFSEKLLMLPDDALPYVPSSAMEGCHIEPVLREQPEVVRIAVCATTMKLNPQFLWALAAIVRKATRRIEYHFLVGFAQGLVGLQVSQILKQYLGDFVVVHTHQPYMRYMEVIQSCDMFLNPFPFGNTNGIVDTALAGHVGVCRTGREVHEHIDEGLFRRLGLPEWTIARTTEAYIDAAVRLIDHDDERLALRRKMIGEKAVDRLFRGRPELFGQRMAALLDEKKALQQNMVTA